MAKPTRDELEHYIVNNREKYNQLAEFYSRYNPEYFNEVFRVVETKHKINVAVPKNAKTRIGPFLLFGAIIGAAIFVYFVYFAEKKENIIITNIPAEQKEVEPIPDIIDSRKKFEGWQEDYIERSRSRSKNIILVKPENNVVYIYGQTITRDLESVAKACVKDYYESTKDNWGEYDITGYLYVNDKLLKTFSANANGVR